MGSTNFLQFNPSQAQQETDSQYLADATRIGGALDGNAWPDVSANKTLYQLSTAVAALMQMMANKGFNVSDANIGTLTAVLMNILTTADTTGGLQSLPWSPSLAFNAAKYSGFQVTLQGATSFTISGQTAGQIIGLLWIQDATGGRTVTFPGNVNGGAQPDPTPSILSAQLFKVDAAGNLDALGPAVSVNGMTGLAINALELTVAGAAPNGQVLTGNGSSYVPQVAPGFSSGNNANGYWEKNPNGRLEQWSPNFSAPGSVTFPVPFTNLSSISVTATEIYAGGSSHYPNIAAGSVTLYGCQISMSDAASSAVTWIATGY
jgi:hypothetical protein